MIKVPIVETTPLMRIGEYGAGKVLSSPVPVGVIAGGPKMVRIGRNKRHKDKIIRL